MQSTNPAFRNLRQPPGVQQGAAPSAAYLQQMYAQPSVGAPARERFLTLDDVVASMGGLLTPVDQAATTGELAAYLHQSFQRAAAQGVVGVRDEGLAAVAPWGFDLAGITVRVAVVTPVSTL